MVSDAAVAHHLIPEDNEAQVVHVLHVILLNVYAVLDFNRNVVEMWGRKTNWNRLVSKSSMSRMKLFLCTHI